MHRSTSHILHRSLRQVPPVAVGGAGVWLVDRQGRRYLDASGGAAVSSLGHGHPDVIAAMHRQIDRCAYAHAGFFTTEVAEELADRLVAGAPDGIKGVHFVSGGSEAMETALKLARQYFVEGGEPGRTLFIARRQSYHGSTLGALAVGATKGAVSRSRRCCSTSSGSRPATGTTGAPPCCWTSWKPRSCNPARSV